MKKLRKEARASAARTTTKLKKPEINQEEEEILRKAQIYLLFEAKCPMFWNVAEIREENCEGGARRWIISVHLRSPSGHEGYLGDLRYDGERFTQLTDVEVMRARVRQIASDLGNLSPSK